MDIVVITPAYGREYKSGSEAIKDFKAGKDFRHHILNATGTYCSIRLNATGTYCSIRDFTPGQEVKIRYRGLRNFAIYTIRGDENGRV